MKFSKRTMTDISPQVFLMLCIIWCKLSGVKNVLDFEEQGGRKITDLNGVENSK